MSDSEPLNEAGRRRRASSFFDVDLSRSTFDDVNLDGAAFTNARLSNITIRNADLSKAAISDANTQGMTIDGVLVSDLFRVYRSLAVD